VTPNAKVIEDMVRGFLDYLTAAPEFAELGVKTFNQLEGKMLPVGADGSIEAPALPAFVLERASNASPAAARDDGATTRTVRLVLDCFFVFGAGAAGQAPESYRAIIAGMTAQDLCCSESARLGGLVGSPYIDDAEFIPGDTEAVPSMSNNRLVLYWVSRFKVVIAKQIRFATA
jgi:hypothetical protein